MMLNPLKYKSLSLTCKIIMALDKVKKLYLSPWYILIFNPLSGSTLLMTSTIVTERVNWINTVMNTDRYFK